MSGEHASFGRLIPRSPSLPDMHAAVVQQAHEIDTAHERDRALSNRLGSIETTQREQGVTLGEIKLSLLNRDHELKKLGAILGLCGALAAPLITVAANYITRPVQPPAIVAPPSAFDRAITACNAIVGDDARGACIGRVVAANTH